MKHSCKKENRLTKEAGSAQDNQHSQEEEYVGGLQRKDSFNIEPNGQGTHRTRTHGARNLNKMLQTGILCSWNKEILEISGGYAAWIWFEGKCRRKMEDLKFHQSIEKESWMLNKPKLRKLTDILLLFINAAILQELLAKGWRFSKVETSIHGVKKTPCWGWQFRTHRWSFSGTSRRHVHQSPAARWFQRETVGRGHLRVWEC